MSEKLNFIIFCFITFWDWTQSQTQQKFVTEPNDKISIVGDTVILVCRVTNKVGSLQWTKDGFGLGTDRELSRFPRYQMIGTDEEGDYSLQISSVTLEDDAIFQCQVGAAEGVQGIRSRSVTLSVLVAPEPPIIVQSKTHSGPFVITSGNNIELTCESHGGRPAAQLNWFDSEEKLVTKGVINSTTMLSDGKRANAVSKYSFVANKEMNGKTLYCRSENSALNSPLKTSIALEVKYAPEIKLTTHSKQLQIGESAKFFCEAEGNPNHLVYKWFKNEEIIVGDHGTRLVLTDLNKYMNGIAISCEVSNSVGASKAKHTLDIAFGPEFTQCSDSVVGADLGKDVKLCCEVSGNPKPDITWLKLGSSQVLNTGSELTVKELSPEKTGQYICRASVKGFNEISKQFMLHINGSPVIISKDIQFGVNGELIKVQCFIDAVPKPKKIQWFYKSKIIENKNGYEIIEETFPGDSIIKSYLLIRDLKSSDFGDYNCSVWNELGFDSKIITLVEESETSQTIFKAGMGTAILIKNFCYNFCDHNSGTDKCTDFHQNRCCPSSFATLALIFGLIIIGIIFLVILTIVIILYLRQRSGDNESDYDLKKYASSQSTYSGKDFSGSEISGTDPSIKVSVNGDSVSADFDEQKNQWNTEQNVKSAQFENCSF